MTSPEPVVVLGRCDEQRAEVFVRVVSPAASGRPRITGVLNGPHCRHAVTLPTAARLMDLGPAPGDGAAEPVLLARATLTEPSFWTPELPHLYRLDLRLWAGDQELARVDRTVGLRRLGVRGRSLWLDGRRFVPRGVACEPAAEPLLPLRDRAAAAVLTDPEEAALAACDAAGVAVIAVAGPGTGGSGWPAAAERLAVWSRHPAVVLGIVPPGLAANAAAAAAAAGRRVKGTLPLGWPVAGDGPPPGETAVGIDVLVVELAAGAVPHPGWRRPPDRPLVAWRNDAVAANARRRACDRLQADLAAWGTATAGSGPPWDWAGYLIR